MIKAVAVKLIICLFVFGVCLYSYINKQNELTALKMELPKLAKDIVDLKEEIKKMQYEVESYENPQYFMDLVRKPQFGYLKHPFIEEVLQVTESVALFEDKDNKELYTQ